jgi:hypothetical protein
MANTLTGIIGQSWKPMVQDFLDNKLVARSVANVGYPTEKDGNTINWAYTPSQRAQTYTYGSNLTSDAVTSVNSTMSLDQTFASVFTEDTTQNRQATTEWVPQQAKQSAYSLANRVDQYSINKGVTLANSNNTVAGGSVTSTTINSILSTARARLDEANAGVGVPFIIASPARISDMALAQIANGFNLADEALNNGFVGLNSIGFKVYLSNNLPSAVTLTVDTQPANLETFTIKGVTWTCVTDGTATNPGEVNIGADLADFKTIFVKVINGTSSADYVDVATDSRRVYQNQQLAATTFSGDTCAITGYGRLNPSETFATATNVFGTVTTQMLAGLTGSISLGIQREIFSEATSEPLQFAINHKTGVLFGATVFHRDTFKLAKITHNE